MDDLYRFVQSQSGLDLDPVSEDLSPGEFQRRDQTEVPAEAPAGGRSLSDWLSVFNRRGEEDEGGERKAPAESEAAGYAFGTVGLLGLALQAGQNEFRFAGIEMEDKSASSANAPDVEADVRQALQDGSQAKIDDLFSGVARSLAVQCIDLDDERSELRVRIDRLGEVRITGPLGAKAAEVLDRMVNLAEEAK